MEFNIENLGQKFEAEVVQSLGNYEYIIKIQGKERKIKIISMTSDKIEFMLDNAYHVAKYLDSSTAKMNLSIDGVKMTFDKHFALDPIVYKYSAAEKGVESQVNLWSQIPGRVVSINAKVGDKVAKGDVLCVLESMKMQVSIKSHKDGVIKSMKIKQGASVAKNDILVEIE